MCGQVKKATTTLEAVDYAIAHAKTYEDGSRWGTKTDSSQRRDVALKFLNDYAPAELRIQARAVLQALPEAKLTSDLDYWTDVIDSN